LQKYKFTLADWKNYRERLEASVGKPGYDRSVAEAEEMIQKLTPSPRPRSHGATVAA
jgi:hypothetical protein